MDYRYKVEFIKTPCELCKELNKNQSSCIRNCFIVETALYPDGRGGWGQNYFFNSTYLAEKLRPPV